MAKKQAGKDKLTKMIEEECLSYTKNIRADIKRMLESATLSLIGLDKRYSNTYNIDHCNNRNSVLIDAFRKVAIQEAVKIAENYKPSAEDTIGFASAFKREMKNSLDYELKQKAKEMAKREAQNLIDAINIDIKSLFNTEENI